ncbi:hypothetical protein PoB_000322900 [Plakobranchus ocellatus]|uniref:Uncharacterized protein n=1 Tax=Plakobranchus ocellatus TaxID=259542 RepID=A0AAV3Y1A1_9GAST|nr:hypothetical protein PoB_000322900 [Plakobranchus ocellatus]
MCEWRVEERVTELMSGKNFFIACSRRTTIVRPLFGTHILYNNDADDEDDLNDTDDDDDDDDDDSIDDDGDVDAYDDDDDDFIDGQY